MSPVNKVAVLLASYNGLQWLPEQVGSILNQDGVAVTLFISHDSSTDGTQQWIEDLVTTDSRVLLLPKTKRMGTAGGNFYRLLRDVDITGFNCIVQRQLLCRTIKNYYVKIFCPARLSKQQGHVEDSIAAEISATQLVSLQE